MKFRHGLMLAALFGVLAGLAWPPQADTPLPTANAEWRAPPDIQRYRPEDAQTLRRDLRWDGQGGKGEQAPKPTLHLRGIVLAPEPTALFQEDGERRLLRASAGKTLPDGSRVEAIDAGRVILRRDGCRRILQLFHPEQVEPGQNCPADGSAND